MDKEQILNIKKFIKDENSTGQRLNSLRLPRDLTLGGAKLPKKQFVPNFNIVRNKEKAKGSLAKTGFTPKFKDNHKKKELHSDRKRDSGRFVQSSGVFSSGVGDDPRRSNRWSDKRSDKENDGAPTSMTMPALKKKNWEVDKKAENNVFDELMNQDDLEDIDEKLPFYPLNWINATSDVKTEIKTEDGVPQSSSSLGCIQPAINKLKLENNPCISSEYSEEFYDDYNPALSLWKLPDSLCGKSLSDDPNCKTLFDYCLDNMLEGQVGKLVIRKSGKMEVHLGKSVYQLEQPNIESYSEDIVALDPETDKGPAATVLGEIKHRYSLNPDWDSLLK